MFDALGQHPSEEEVQNMISEVDEDGEVKWRTYITERIGERVGSWFSYNQATVERFSLVLGSYESYPEHDSFVFDVKRNSFDLV